MPRAGCGDARLAGLSSAAVAPRFASGFA
jgi:hypothetical protein